MNLTLEISELFTGVGDSGIRRSGNLLRSIDLYEKEIYCLEQDGDV